MAEELDFDSKEDYELYKRLMTERGRIQRKEEKTRQTKALKIQQLQKAEDRERGFQLHFAGANEDRLKEARRRQQTSQVPSAGGMESHKKEWQLKTVELPGKDGAVYRSSPHEKSSQGSTDKINEEIQEGLQQESRPSSGCSNPGLDQDTRGVLHMMNAANHEQLSWLRQSLTSQFEQRVQSAGSGLPPQPNRSSRPTSASLTSIADEENARVKQLSETLEEAVASAASRPGDFTSGGSRPSSRSSRSRLPLGPEEAAQAAPPSVIAKVQAPPIAASIGGSAGYPGLGPIQQPQPIAAEPRQSSAVTPSADVRGFPEEIFDRVSRLDQRKQKALLKVLESLEADHPISVPAAPPAALPAPPQRDSQPAQALDLCLRVTSNWGDSRQCGLSLIEALDSEAEVIKIPPAALSLHGALQGSTTLARVVEGKPNSQKPLWLATVCQRAHGDGFEPIDLKLNLPSTRVAALRIWNFNSQDGLAKGVRDIEVCQGNAQIWTGQLPMGNGGAVVPILVPISPGFSEDLALARFKDETKSSSILQQDFEQSDRPFWLMHEQQRQVDAQGWAQMRSHPRLEDEQEELLQSLQALELFRSSQSRRFFSDRRYSECEESQQGLEPAPPAPSPIPTQMDEAHLDHDLVAEAAAMGLDLPVRTFNGTDVLDSLISTDPAMGSSLLTDQLGQFQSVVIPTLPSGRQLVFNCVSTWGDKDFVGLAGIELFDGHGFPVVLKDVGRQVTADPHSINVLSEYDHDPRTPDKLFDQVNLTRDDLHVWLAPFFPGRAHTITVDMDCKTEISMIRVWNYNKSRLHSSRGVRDMEILLDGIPIFIGEVRRAPGVLTQREEACEVILFTQDESVLEAVAEHDWLPACLPADSEDEESAEAVEIQVEDGRPPTAGLQVCADSPRGQKTPRAGLDGRPMTRATERQPRGKVCSSLTFTVHSTWGDQFYVGLTAPEVLDSSLSPIPRDEVKLDAVPRDLNDLEGVDEDTRILENIFDGVCCTTEDSHMWLAPFIKAPAGNSSCDSAEEIQRNTIHIGFAKPCEVAGFNIWNYNKNEEDTSRGIREFSVHCDDRYISTFLCRKAPGHTHFDFKQLVLLDQPPSESVRRSARAVARLPSRSASKTAGAQKPPLGRPPSGSDRRANADNLIHSPSPNGHELRQQYETPLHPCGFVFKFMFLSTWSDVHYIGLDGIEIYDTSGRGLRPKRAYSNYGSVRDLPGMEADVRSEDSLLKGTPQNARMWLAPYYRQPANFVELVFDQPTQISVIKFWNYSRTPARGVRDVEIYVDDLIIYQGILRQASGQDGGEAVLFTDQPSILERERSLVYQPSPEDLIAFFDESGQWDQRTGNHIPCVLHASRGNTAAVKPLRI